MEIRRCREQQEAATIRLEPQPSVATQKNICGVLNLFRCRQRHDPFMYRSFDQRSHLAQAVQATGFRCRRSDAWCKKLSSVLAHSISLVVCRIANLTITATMGTTMVVVVAIDPPTTTPNSNTSYRHLGTQAHLPKWRLKLAPQIGASNWHLKLAPQIGASNWHLKLAPQIGTSNWHLKLAPQIGTSNWRLIVEATANCTFKLRPEI